MGETGNTKTDTSGGEVIIAGQHPKVPMKQFEKMNQPKLNEMRGLKNPAPRIIPKNIKPGVPNNLPGQGIPLGSRTSTWGRLWTGMLNLIGVFNSPLPPVIMIAPVPGVYMNRQQYMRIRPPEA